MSAVMGFSEARSHLSEIFNKAMDEQPTLIRRNSAEYGVLLGRTTALRLLDRYRFTTNVIPDDDGSFTLWVEELKLGANGATLAEARTDLLATVRAFTIDYTEHFSFYRNFTDLLALEPYVHRLHLAADDRELWSMLHDPKGERLAAHAPPPAIG